MEEKDKYKNLHLLIDRVSSRLSIAEEENLTLKQQVKNLQLSLKTLEQTQETLKELKAWKEASTAALKKLSAKVQKEIDRIEEQSSRPNIGGI